MQLDYKDIIIKHYALSMSGSEIARQTGFSKSGVNDFLRAFKKCEDLQYPLPAGITNYGIAMKVYGSVPGSGGRNENIELPDYEEAANLFIVDQALHVGILFSVIQFVIISDCANNYLDVLKYNRQLQCEPLLD